ncbi:MAG: 30S ribosomal protein S18 [Candidatus Omnitrophica bacterium]|nr:30S ribosomal protein S18 [Candidatus Omnitrophota bacterium]MDD5671106.1 30S ribosomal protein S18 [Candidatus Omnitrophota bacterium]
MLRRKVCRFCQDHAVLIDFKDRDRIIRFLTEKGKIIPRRTTGTCARHQRMLTRAIKRARHAAIIAFQEV